MDEVEISGAVVLPIDGCLMSIDYIEWQGRAWLVPIWIEDNEGCRRPARLIGPNFCPEGPPVRGPSILQIFREMPLTSVVLVRGAASGTYSPILEIIERPNVCVRVY